MALAIYKSVYVLMIVLIIISLCKSLKHEVHVPKHDKASSVL